jgi:putative ABC transport system permease protein
MRVTAVGLVVGLLAALGAGRVLASQLFEVDLADPLVIAQTAVVVLVVAAAACLVPAWRASRLAPTTALTSE